MSRVVLYVAYPAFIHRIVHVSGLDQKFVGQDTVVGGVRSPILLCDPALRKFSVESSLEVWLCKIKTNFNQLTMSDYSLNKANRGNECSRFKRRSLSTNRCFTEENMCKPTAFNVDSLNHVAYPYRQNNVQDISSEIDLSVFLFFF
jgi:hypothetical protein